jgi:hypothetical protein
MILVLSSLVLREMYYFKGRLLLTMSKLKLLILVVAALLGRGAYAQQLEMHRTLGGAHFMRDTLYLSHRQVSEILSVDPQAHAEFKIARNNYRIGGLMGFAGAALLAIPVFSAVAGGEPEWVLAGGGAALLIASIPFSRSFKNRSQAAIDGYNLRHVKPESRLYNKYQGLRPKFYFTGAGATLRF